MSWLSHSFLMKQCDGSYKLIPWKCSIVCISSNGIRLFQSSKMIFLNPRYLQIRKIFKIFQKCNSLAVLPLNKIKAHLIMVGIQTCDDLPQLLPCFHRRWEWWLLLDCVDLQWLWDYFSIFFLLDCVEENIILVESNK